VPRICKVLVVEDHDGIRQVIGRALAADGFRFTLLPSGGAVRQALESGDYDVAIIDVPLEKDDALALADLAAQEGVGVILTAAHDQHLPEIERLGHRQLLKPFKLPPLLLLIRTILRELENHCIRRKARPSSVAG
jgi:two-component system OmpR family response regulator